MRRKLCTFNLSIVCYMSQASNQQNNNVPMNKLKYISTFKIWNTYRPSYFVSLLRAVTKQVRISHPMLYTRYIWSGVVYVGSILMSFLNANIDITPAKSEQTAVCANIIVNSDAVLHTARKRYKLGLSTFCSKMSVISQSTVRVAPLQMPCTFASHANGS